MVGHYLKGNKCQTIVAEVAKVTNDWVNVAISSEKSPQFICCLHE